MQTSDLSQVKVGDILRNITDLYYDQNTSTGPWLHVTKCGGDCVFPFPVGDLWIVTSITSYYSDTANVINVTHMSGKRARIDIFWTPHHNNSFEKFNG